MPTKKVTKIENSCLHPCVMDVRMILLSYTIHIFSLMCTLFGICSTVFFVYIQHTTSHYTFVCTLTNIPLHNSTYLQCISFFIFYLSEFFFAHIMSLFFFWKGRLKKFNLEKKVQYILVENWFDSAKRVYIETSWMAKKKELRYNFCCYTQLYDVPSWHGTVHALISHTIFQLFFKFSSKKRL